MFSEREKKVIKILKRRPMTYEQISRQLFKDDPDRPFDENISVGNTIRRIIKKCEHHNLYWTIEKSRHTYPMTVQKVTK